MLNEVYLLRQALEQAGAPIPREHPRVKPPGKTTGPFLRVTLNKKGCVEGVETVSEEEQPGLWTIMEGNQNSFPVVRLKDPLLILTGDDARWKELGFDGEGKRKKPPDALRRGVLGRVLDDCGGLASEKTVKDWKRLQAKAGELLAHAIAGEQDHAVLAEFARRFQEGASDPSTLFAQIVKQAVKKLLQARLEQADLDAVEMLLVGKGPPDNRGKRPPMTVQLVFDVDERPEGSCRLFSEQMRTYVISILPVDRRESSEGGSEPEGAAAANRCAFTGRTNELQTSAFPKVQLPVLGKGFPLVSMFSEAECNKRYGLTGSLVVPVAQEAARRMQDALTFIVADVRKGKTWRGVASGKFEASGGRKKERYDLLIVYVDGKPDINVNVADAFGTDEGVVRKQFEIETLPVCKALDGIRKERPGSKLNLFLLRKASEGQAHVAVVESFSVEEVLAAVEWWQEAATNVPDVTLPLPGNRGERAEVGRPHPPFPEQVVRLLSEEWVTRGTRSNKVEGVSLSHVLDLMFRKPGKWEATALRMLDLAVRRVGPLMLGIFGALHSGDARQWTPYLPSTRLIALRAVSVLGILLRALGRRKDTYVNETAFLVGRLLAQADTLHREYCKHVRGGDIPPQLIGNALMPFAADNPQDAVDRLRERMNIYKAWADKADGAEYRLAKWAVGQMGEVCRRLPLPLPTQTNQAFRAELFLGYMARPPRKAGPGETDNDPSVADQGE